MSATYFLDCSVTQRLYPDRFDVNIMLGSLFFQIYSGISISQRYLVWTYLRLGRPVSFLTQSRQSYSLILMRPSQSCSISQDYTSPFCGRGMSPSHFMYSSNCARFYRTGGRRPLSSYYSYWFCWSLLQEVRSCTSLLLLNLLLCLRSISSACQLLLKCYMSYLNYLSLAELTSSKQMAFSAMALTEQWQSLFTIFYRSGSLQRISVTLFLSMLTLSRSQMASRRWLILTGSRRGCISHLLSSLFPNFVVVLSILLKRASFYPIGVSNTSRCCRACESIIMDIAEPSRSQKAKRTALMMQSNLRQLLRYLNMPASVARMSFSSSPPVFQRDSKMAGRGKTAELTRFYIQFLVFMGCHTFSRLGSLVSTMFSQFIFMRSTIQRGRLSGSQRSQTGRVWKSIVLKSQRVQERPTMMRLVPIYSREQAMRWLCFDTAMRQLGRYCWSSSKDIMVPLVSTWVTPLCSVFSVFLPQLRSLDILSFIWSGVSSCSTTTSLQPSWTNSWAYFYRHFQGKPTCILLPIHLRSRKRLPMAASSQNIQQNLPNLNRISLSQFQLFMRQYCFMVSVRALMAQGGRQRVVGSYSGWLGLWPFASRQPSRVAHSGVTSVNYSSGASWPEVVGAAKVARLGLSSYDFLVTDFGGVIEGLIYFLVCWFFYEECSSFYSISIFQKAGFLCQCLGMRSSSMSILRLLLLMTVTVSNAKSPLLMSSLKLLFQWFQGYGSACSSGGERVWGAGVVWSMGGLSAVGFYPVLGCLGGGGGVWFQGCCCFLCFMKESKREICFMRRVRLDINQKCLQNQLSAHPVHKVFLQLIILVCGQFFIIDQQYQLRSKILLRKGCSKLDKSRGDINIISPKNQNTSTQYHLLLTPSPLR